MLDLFIIRRWFEFLGFLFFEEIHFIDSFFYMRIFIGLIGTSTICSLFTYRFFLLFIMNLIKSIIKTNVSFDHWFTSLVDSRISPSSSLSKSYGFFPVVVIVNNDVSLFPLTVRVLLDDTESDDCSRKRWYG
jgi:hypothetical protein